MKNIMFLLADEEIDNILQCVRLVVDKDVFEEWEFETLFGVSRDLYLEIFKSWPNVCINNHRTTNMLINAMNHSLGYPWGDEEKWKMHFSATPDDVMRTLTKLLQLSPHN
jgi:hypothetical protein